MPDDPADLRERVRELEQTVSEQQQTIQKLMPSRRAVLSGLVGAGAGAAGVYAGTDRAQASGHSGQVGTSSDPVNVEGHDVTVANEFRLGGDGPATSFDDLGLGNPLSADLDFGGNDATNVGAVNANIQNTDQTTVEAKPTSDQTITNGSTVTLNIDSADIEDADILTVDTTNNEVTIDEAGKYRIEATARFKDQNLTSGDQIRCEIQLNGSAIDRSQGRRAHSGAVRESISSRPVVRDLAVNDTIEYAARQDSGGDEVVEAAFATGLQIIRV